MHEARLLCPRSRAVLDGMRDTSHNCSRADPHKAETAVEQVSLLRIPASSPFRWSGVESKCNLVDVSRRRPLKISCQQVLRHFWHSATQFEVHGVVPQKSSPFFVPPARTGWVDSASLRLALQIPAADGSRRYGGT